VDENLMQLKINVIEIQLIENRSRESAPTNNREQPQTTAQQNTARRGWGVSCGHETVVEN
jgi:hypothetical protein